MGRIQLDNVAGPMVMGNTSTACLLSGAVLLPYPASSYTDSLSEQEARDVTQLDRKYSDTPCALGSAGIEKRSTPEKKGEKKGRWERVPFSQ